jgi:hypothetical protein
VTTTITSADLEGLLVALSHENWFEMLPVIHDAYREQNDEAGDAVAWLLANKKRPNCNNKGSYCWAKTGSFLIINGEWSLTPLMVNEIDELNHYVVTRTIQPQLTAFVEVWLTGMRPY